MIDLDSTLFNINVENGTPKEGSLLVAEPFLSESHFNHAVILLIDYALASKSMGIVMNRSTSYSLGQLVDSVDDSLSIPVYCGGPMSYNRLFYIHSLGPMFSGSREIPGGLYIGGDFNDVTEYISEGYPVDGLIRFFVGYSGWDAGQLDDEISSHVWAVAKQMDHKDMLIGADDTYWHKTVRSMGDKYRGWLYHPMHPSAN